MDDNLIERLKTKIDHIDWGQLIALVQHHENSTRHDVIAFLQSLEDLLGEDARYIHMGLTSSDIVDTAQSLLIRQALEQILKQLKETVHALWLKAEQYKGVPCLGRTHGQAAEPMTFGIKLLSHVAEMQRSYKRLELSLSDCSIGKLSGAVGVYALTDPCIEEHALAQLSLYPETIATQVVARDRHAAMCTAMAVLAGSIERFAVEIRLLMHGQVQEVSEPFFAQQKGSSAMPHKKNPILSENLTGLMRLVRSYAQASLENQALWHERDISHSSVERVIIPDMFHVMDFALMRLINLVNNLQVDESRMLKNLHSTGEALCSQKVLMALIKKGLMRQQAYEIVQKAVQSGSDFNKQLVYAGASQFISSSELNEIISSQLHISHEETLFDRIKGELSKAGLLPT